MAYNHKIKSIINEVETMDLDTLREAFISEKDQKRQELLNALYTYALDKKQTELLKNKEFVI